MQITSRGKDLTSVVIPSHISNFFSSQNYSNTGNALSANYLAVGVVAGQASPGDTVRLG